MQFIRADRTAAINQITARINRELSKGKVLLLLSGGSNVNLGILVVRGLTKTENLTLGLVDERYGSPGHPDSNWQKLLDSGLTANKAKTLPVLHQSISAAETAQRYSVELRQAKVASRTVIAIFGMGTDGHTSGVLPDSPAVHSTDIFVSYSGPDFERLTTTPQFFKLIDLAFLVTYGESKLPMLRKLESIVPVDEQPAQALKDTKELIVYNDQIG